METMLIVKVRSETKWVIIAYLCLVARHFNSTFCKSTEVFNWFQVKVLESVEYEGTCYHAGNYKDEGHILKKAPATCLVHGFIDVFWFVSRLLDAYVVRLCRHYKILLIHLLTFCIIGAKIQQIKL